MNQQPPARPPVPTGVVPSRLTSDQPTLLQPWTPAEQEQLRAAREVVERLTARQATARQKAFDALSTLLSASDSLMLHQVVDNAEAVRDILKPFDSGVRGAAGGA